jgi:hypothetical protein
MHIINGNTSFAALEAMRQSLRDGYGEILCYHSCKVYDQHDYQDGLQVASSELVRKIANKVFRVEDYIHQQKVSSLISRYTINDIGVIHFSLDKRLFQDAFHYLRFGSESLFKLADELKLEFPEYNFRKMMVERGTPTLISFRVSIDQLPAAICDEIDSILETAIENRWRDPFIGASFFTKSSVPRDQFVALQKVNLPQNLIGIPE